MKYRATIYFTDLQDNNHPYNSGDIFPRSGLDVSAERIKELLSSDNKRGIPVIEAENDGTEKPPVEEKIVEVTEETPTETEEIKKYSSAELKAMSKAKIGDLAKSLGYTISDGSKNKMIDEFIAQQG